MFPLDVRNASASSTMRALLTLCVRFEISPGYPIAAAIRFHPVLSARLPISLFARGVNLEVEYAQTFFMEKCSRPCTYTETE